jgi:acyl carrier protein
VSRDLQREELIAFLESIERPDAPLGDIDEDTQLVDSGLIDSLAMIEIIGFLESRYDIDFSETGVDPDQMGSVSHILDLIEARAK